MTICPCLRFCRGLLASALAVFCLWRSYDVASGYFNADDAYSYTDTWRSAARLAPKGGLALLGDKADCIEPIDRSRLIAISWERAPDPLSLVDENGDLGAVDCVLSSAWYSSSARRKLESEGFAVVATNEYVTMWGRKGATYSEPAASHSPVSTTRELIVLLLELVLMVVGVRMAIGPRSVGKWALLAAVFVVTILGCIALSHSLLPPNGLGVYAGKAKLLFECGGIPEAYLRSTGGKVLQLSYPPGLTLLAYLHFLLSGGCGDRLVQLIVVFAMALLCVVMLRGRWSARMALPVLIYCLSPVAVRLTAGFYAEPFAALVLVLGWGMMDRGKFLSGALVMGTAGLFRPEAGIVAACFTIGSKAVGSNLRRAMLAMGMTIVPTVGWHLFAHMLGYGSLHDWNMFMPPRFGQVLCAEIVALKSVCEQAVPIFGLLFVLAPSGAELWPRLRRPLIAAALLILVVSPFACGFYDAPFGPWMMENTLPRLVWYVLAISLDAAAGRTSFKIGDEAQT